MRILNRPMFRTGGPIKEGIMQGMRNGGRAALVGNPVYPQTGGREHHQYVAKDYEAIEKAKNIGQIYDAPFLDKQFRKKWYLDMEPHQVTTGPVDPSRFQFQYMVPDRHLSKPKFRKRSDIINDPKAYDYYKKEYIEDEWRKKIDKQKELLTKAGDERVSSLYEYEVPTKAAGTTSRWDKTAPTLTSSQREDLAKKQQGERLKTYLDMMGYDSAKKGAMSKALIDASALVQDATTEAGSIKHADWGNLINKAIQTTSRRMEKPEQIREAVGLMMTKAELEKDVLKAKGSPQKQLAKDYVDAGVYKTMEEAMAAIGKEATFEDNLLAMSVKRDGKVSGSDLNILLHGTKGEKAPRKSVPGSDTAYKKFKEKMEDAGNDSQIELEFVDKMIDDKQPGDSFIIDDSLIIVKSDGSLAYRVRQR